MVDVLDVEVGVLLVDQLAEGRGVLGVAVVGDGRKARGERGERLGGGLRPGELLVVEGDRAVEVEHRDQALLEATLLDGDVGPALRFGGVGVERLAGDALDGGDGVGAHALVGLRMELLEMRVVGPHRQQALLGQRHHLGAARRRRGPPCRP